MKKASIIQRRFRLYMLKSKTNKKLKELRTDQMKVWTQMQNEFKLKWPKIKTQRRTEIHINSFSISEI
jgi:hypothetical protein|tara:strand:- start:970 stop:1173 length:204 start_codon:yes stop_codon:yes gene_type:complete